MILLRTKWGDYLLSNALKIDFFSEYNKDKHDVFLSIDNYKHLIYSFESDKDAYIFVDEMRQTLLNWFHISVEKKFYSAELDTCCREALNEVLERVVV